MRLFAWSGRLPGLSFAPPARLRASKQQLMQAAQTDPSQALNPKSLVSTTNKLQQFVAEVEKLECFILRQRNVAVIVERGDSQSCLSSCPRARWRKGGDGTPAPGVASRRTTSSGLR